MRHWRAKVAAGLCAGSKGCFLLNVHPQLVQVVQYVGPLSVVQDGEAGRSCVKRKGIMGGLAAKR